METLKKINEKLLKETIESNLVLKSLNEALDTKNLNVLGNQLEALNNLVNTVMPTFNSLKQAIQQAEKDVNVAVSDPKKAKNVTGKVISFYSKLWGFLSNDLVALSRLPAMRDFFDDKKTPDENSTLNNSPNVQNVRSQILAALKSDNSPWFKKALAMLTNDPNYLNSIPYLDLNTFVTEFTSLPKKQLKDSLEKINAQIKQIQNPENIATQIANPNATEQQQETSSELKGLVDKTRAELNTIYRYYRKALGEKVNSVDAQTLLKQLIVNSFMENRNSEQMDAKIKSEFKY